MLKSELGECAGVWEVDGFILFEENVGCVQTLQQIP